MSSSGYCRLCSERVVVDDFVDDVCKSCVEDMETETLIKWLVTAGPFDADYIREVLADRSEEKVRA